MRKKILYSRTDTDDNMAYAHYMLGTEDYKYTLRICNIYWFPLQQWLKHSTSLLRYMHIACLVYCVCKFARPYFLCNWVYVMYLQVLLAFIWQMSDGGHVSWPKSVAVLFIKKCPPRQLFSWIITAPLNDFQYSASYEVKVASRAPTILSRLLLSYHLVNCILSELLKISTCLNK